MVLVLKYFNCGTKVLICAQLRLLALGDAIVCYLAMFFKAILVEVALAQGAINRRRVGYLLELEEAFLSLYRQLLPIATSLPLAPPPTLFLSCPSPISHVWPFSLSLSLSLSHTHTLTHSLAL